MKTTQTTTTNTTASAIRLLFMAGDHIFSKCFALAAKIDAGDTNPVLLAKLNEGVVLYRANRANLEALANNGEPVSGHMELELRLAVGL